MTRDELWLKHDARSRLDPKMAHYIHLRGMMGYGVFWALIETLHYQNNHEIDIETELEGIAYQLGFTWENFKPVVDDLVTTGLLKIEDGKLFQSKLKHEQAKRSKTKQNLSEIRAEAGRKGGIIKALRSKNEENLPEFATLANNFATICQNFASSPEASKNEFCQTENNNENEELVANAKQTLANALEEKRVEESRGEEKRDTPDGVTSPKPPKGFREGCIAYGEYQKVFLLPREYQDLCSKFSKAIVDSKITSLDANIENKIKKYLSYSNHAACIRSWCSTDKSLGRLPKEEQLPDGFHRVGKGIIKAPDGNNYQESFLRSINFTMEGTNG